MTGYSKEFSLRKNQEIFIGVQMKKIIFVLLFLSVLLSLSALFGKKIGVVKNDFVIFRKGSASHFKPIGAMRKNDVFFILSKENNWYKINFADSIGYVSAKDVAEIKTKENGKTKETIAKSKIYAAVLPNTKKLANYFREKFNGNRKFISVYDRYTVNEENFARFKKGTYHSFKLKKNLQKIPLPPAKDGYFSQTESGIGLGMAAGIVSDKLYRNPLWQEYLNDVGNIVVENSDVYDWNFKFFILDSPAIGTYALPGGIVFITKGLLENIETEAELVFVLAREVARISHYFGTEQLYLQKDKFENIVLAEKDWNLITRDSLFSELENITSEIYGSLSGGKTIKSAEETDYLGFIYAARSGYNSREAIALFKRLILVAPVSVTQEYSVSALEKRLSSLKKRSQKSALPKKLFTHKKRWKEKEVFLD